MKTNFVMLILVLAIIFVSGCTKTITTKIRAAPHDSITMEATVLTLAKTDSCLKNEEVCSTDTVPRDYAKIRINKIVNYNQNSEVKYNSLEEGQEVDVRFIYSARPAKLRCMSLPPEQQGSSSEEQSNEKRVPQKLTDSEIEKLNSVPKENGFYIYTYYTAQCPEEKVLVGVSEGNKIRFTLEYSGDLGNLHVKDYEVVS